MYIQGEEPREERRQRDIVCEAPREERRQRDISGEAPREERRQRDIVGKAPHVGRNLRQLNVFSERLKLYLYLIILCEFELSNMNLVQFNNYIIFILWRKIMILNYRTLFYIN